MRQRRANLALLLVTVIWGTTFTIVHEAVAAFPAFALIFLRFGLASLALWPVIGRDGSLGRLSRRELGIGIGLGMLLFVGFGTQTLGLVQTTPSRAGFITGLNVVFVPILGWLWGDRPRMAALLGVACAVVGLATLTWGCSWGVFGCSIAAQTQGWSRGDTLVLICAVAFALHIVAVGRWATNVPSGPLNAIQLATVTGCAALVLPWLPASAGWGSVNVWLAAAFLGVIATALVFGLQLWAQRFVSATRTALMFALEPVFAAVFAWWWIGDQPNAAVWVGGMLMVLGVMISELPLERWAAAIQPARS